MRIHRGVPTDNTNFKCDYEHYQNEYNQIETTVYRKNIKVEYYFDPYKNMNVFIKKVKKYWLLYEIENFEIT